MNKDMKSKIFLVKSKDQNYHKIPKTGKIGRFANNIKKETNSTVFQKVMEEIEEFESTTDKAKKAKWMQEAIKRLENTVGREKSINIMEKCGRECFNQHKWHKQQVMSKAMPIEEIVVKFSTRSFKLRIEDKNTIIAEYKRCLCHLVKQTKAPFPTNTYCHCSVGWWKQFFEYALKKPVEAELVQSVITGAESCKFIIHI